ncbi:MAG: pyrroloquinoline quinone biosynthesis peptide chaperone PqqD [Deltaproteobacteria bacterium]|jgi:pyrroloquinoline quinone biosynthesis protein D|nr:pyrroloquinoline quinone biosynthesis peptide chaperone PqqD [Deltaproteobacteria bacterium]MBW2478179.1 pyrroloquinoline quinone biosynthesis peptide chaperone PqqD [Deltaproteobacteria bacterium]MBW2504811.1 pyrroloquinoline quinone biosynthesis peptide chaperone PqqD [Deltaproteobacteria bacterium]MBW2520327.1 pyrroloquinoline quinone biosynthesis peptide chaperone PqqD [Deltaproteobacteria bacterium]
MKKPLRNQEIVWRIEKRRQSEALDALEAGRDVDELGTVTLIQAGVMHQLNLVGGMVWERCDGHRTVEDIVDDLAGEFDVERGVLKNDVEIFINDLLQKGWLTDG